MHDDSVIVQPESAGDRLRFDAASGVVDCRLAEGRSETIALRAAARDVSAATMAGHVARRGHAHRGGGAPASGAEQPLAPQRFEIPMGVRR